MSEEKIHAPKSLSKFSNSILDFENISERFLSSKLVTNFEDFHKEIIEQSDKQLIKTEILNILRRKVFKQTKNSLQDQPERFRNPFFLNFEE